MARFTAAFGLLATVLPSFFQPVVALDVTDTITWGGDVSRSGYQTTHNMDPNIVGSPAFGQIFQTNLPGNWNGIGPEQIFSQPLVYTGADGVQYIYLATTQNNIYKLNAKSGVIVAKRNLWTPFLTADLDGCVDINPTVGVTSTGVIDPSTSVWYLTAKTYSQAFQSGNYSPSKTPGRLNGRYYFHGINTADLTDAFAAVPLEGTIFRNNANRMFLSGNQHQRPALLQVNNNIYAGFASHCVKWNFTGAVLGFNKQTGAIIEAFATEAGPESNSIPGGGVWMSGGGLSYDQGSIYFATGNGYTSQLAATGQSVPGRQPPTALEEAAVNAKINDDGTLSVIDFFMPWEKTQLDGADKDLGTSPLQILPSSTFSCPNHRRIGMVTGKSGKSYWLNLDNLGGYQMSADKHDAIIGWYQNENSVYAGAGVMPLGGGYVYTNVIQYPTHAFKFSCDGNGNAVFTKVADSPEKCAYILGVGHGTTTSLNGQEGTGLLWVSDVEGYNLRIYNAIPSGGNLTLINKFNIPGVTKFTRPVFGNGRVYMGTTVGAFYGFGSPVSLPINCSSPIGFPNTFTGNTSSPVTINCSALIQTTVNSLALAGNPNYVLSNLPTTPLNLAAGGTFSFTAVFAPKSIGLLSSDVLVNTTNGVTGYLTSTPVTLKGQANSANPLLAVNPNTVSFTTIVGSGSSTQSFLYYNNGNGLLTISNMSYSLTSETGPWITPNVTANGTQVGPFTFNNVPSTIPGNSQVVVSVTYNPVVAANDAVFVKAFSNGGSALLDVLGSAGTLPVAVFQFQNPNGGGWVTYDPSQGFSFGNVTENSNRNLVFRILNNGSSTAAPLSLTVSKPPYGVPGFVGAVNSIDLAEGTRIVAGQSANATLYCSPPKSQVNLPSYQQTVQWTINTNDLNSGKQFINFTCNAVAEQYGPLYPNGTATYGYIGCARDNNPGRQLLTQVYADTANNTNQRCITTCAAQGYIFAGTEYNQQCWCGNAVPILFDPDLNCNFQCTGNTAQTCGGNGFYGNTSQISLFGDSTRFNGNKTSPPLHIVQVYNNYNYAGCYAESGGKALGAASTSGNSMTVEVCGAFCSKSNYNYFGIEYGQECYCGNTINPSTATITADSQCNMVCPGSNSEYCGNGNRMLIYGLNATAPVPTSSSTSVGATTSGSSIATGSSTTTTSITPSTTGVVPSASGYVSLGCYNENTGSGGRVLANLYASSSMTIELCASTAAQNKATYFGVEYGRECWYGPTLSSISQPISQSLCNIACPGNTGEWCGGSNALQMYTLGASSSSSTSISSTSVSSTTTSVSVSSATTTAAPVTSSSSTLSVSSSTTSTSSPTATTPVVVPSASGYASLGCYSENTGSGGRVLTNLYPNSSMTIEMCAGTASNAKAVYFGVEYGRECWYGTTLSSISQPIAQSKCNMFCPGNSLEWCGGGNALQMYSLAPASSTSSSSSATSTSSVVSISTSSVSTTTTSATSSSTTLSTSSASISTVSTTSTTAPASSTLSTSTSSSSTSIVSSTSSSSTTTSSSSTTSSSTTTSVTPTQTPLVCPGSNGTNWQAPSGNQYVIECNIDHAGGDINSTYVASYEACIIACDNQKGCVDISLSGYACYMKGKLGTALSNTAIRGARLVTSTTTAVVSTATGSASH